jgi:hypothetical protein
MHCPPSPPAAAIQDRFDALLPHCAARGMHVAMLDVMPRPTSVPSKDPKSYVALKTSSAVSSGAMGVGDAVHDYVVRPVASLVGISLERSTGPSDAAAPVANRTGGDQAGTAKQQRAVSITPPRSMDGMGRQFGAYVLGMRLASRDCWRISVDRSAARESRCVGISIFCFFNFSCPVCHLPHSVARLTSPIQPQFRDRGRAAWAARSMVRSGQKIRRVSIAHQGRAPHSRCDQPCLEENRCARRRYQKAAAPRVRHAVVIG